MTVIWTIAMGLIAVSAFAFLVASIDSHSLYQYRINFDAPPSHQWPRNFDDDRLRILQTRSAWLGCLYLTGAISLLIIRKRLCRFVSKGLVFLLYWRHNARRFWQHLPAEDRSHVLMVSGLMLLSAVLLSLYCLQTIRTDEAKSFLEYGWRPIYRSICFYKPNNHIFHSVLMRLSTLLFGEALWSIRLPTMTGAVFMVPLIYAVGRQFFSSRVGLLAAAILASSAYFIHLGTNARGYTIMTDCFLALLLLAGPIVRGQSNAWFGFVTIASIGAWTVLVMFYPFSIVVMFILIDRLRVTRLHHLGRFLISFTAAIVATALIIGLLFSPTFLTAHVTLKQSSNVIIENTSDSMESLPLLFLNSMIWFWRMATMTWPQWLTIVNCALVATGVFASIRKWPKGFLLFLATFLVPILLTIATNILIPSWSYAFLFPIGILLIAAGAVYLTELCLGQTMDKLACIAMLTAITTSVHAGALLLSSYPKNVPYHAGYSDAAAAADFLADHIGPEVSVMGHNLVLIPVEYYYYHITGLFELPRFSESESTKTVYVIENFDRASPIDDFNRLTDLGFHIADFKTLSNSQIIRYDQSSR